MRAFLACCILVTLTSFISAEELSGVSSDEQAIVDQTNALRKRAGQQELRLNPVLARVARKHAEAMARANSLSHRLNGKSSSDRVDAAGYKWTTVSENIAWNQRSVPEVMSGWMRSEGHRANLLGNDVTEMGAGIAVNSKGEFYFVQVFARPEALTKFTTLKFVVKNATDAGASVDVRVGKLFALKPGEAATYTLTTPTAVPSISVAGSGRALEFNVQNGAQYIVGRRDGHLELMQPAQDGP